MGILKALCTFKIPKPLMCGGRIPPNRNFVLLIPELRKETAFLTLDLTLNLTPNLEFWGLVEAKPGDRLQEGDLDYDYD